MNTDEACSFPLRNSVRETDVEMDKYHVATVLLELGLCVVGTELTEMLTA